MTFLQCLIAHKEIIFKGVYHKKQADIGKPEKNQYAEYAKVIRPSHKTAFFTHTHLYVATRTSIHMANTAACGRTFVDNLEDAQKSLALETPQAYHPPEHRVSKIDLELNRFAESPSRFPYIFKLLSVNHNLLI